MCLMKGTILKKIITRFIIYLSGLLILAIGIAFSIRSQSGVSPVSSIPIVFSQITGKSVGTMTFMFYLACIFLQIIILRKNFRARDLLQIVFSSIFGVFTDFALFLIGGVTASTYIGQLTLLFISVVLISIGVFFILVSDLVTNAPDGLCLTISKKWNLKFSSVKSKFDLTCIVISVAVSLLVFGNLSQIREGTIISAICVGRLIGILQHRYSDRVKSLFSEVQIDSPCFEAAE